MNDLPNTTEITEDENQPGISRREVAKLLGAAAALASTLGVVFEVADAQAFDADQVKINLYLLPPDGNEKRRELLGTINLSPESKRKLLAAALQTLQTEIVGVKAGKDTIMSLGKSHYDLKQNKVNNQ